MVLPITKENITLLKKAIFYNNTSYKAILTGFLLLYTFEIVSFNTDRYLSAVEQSIYDSINAPQWIVLFVLLVSGIVCVFQCHKRTNFVGISLILCGLSNVVLLPLLKGYYINSIADVLFHLGRVNEIIQLGHVSLNNWYPLDHIYGSILLLVTNIQLHQISYIVPLSFVVLYILSSYVLAKKIYLDNKNTIGFAIFVSIVISPIAIRADYTPFGQSLMLMPLLVYLSFNLFFSKNFNVTGMRLVFILYLIYCTVFHPLFGVITLSIVTILALAYFAYRSNLRYVYKENPLPYLLISLSVFIIWMGYFYAAVKLLNRNLLNFFSDSSNDPSEFTVLQNYGNQLNLIDIIHNVTNIYGDSLILIFLMIFELLLLVIVFISIPDASKRFENRNILLFSITCSILSLIGFIILFAFIKEFNASRFLYVFYIFCAIVVACAHSTILNLKIFQKRVRIFLHYIIMVLIISAVIIGSLNFHVTPFTNSMNAQILESDVQGSQFFLEKNVKSYGILEVPSLINRLMQYRGFADLNKVSTKTMIDHFGYDTNISFTKNYEGHNYFLTSQRIEYIHDFTNKENAKFWKYTPDEIMRFKSDPSLSLIYSNGNFYQYIW